MKRGLPIDRTDKRVVYICKDGAVEGRLLEIHAVRQIINSGSTPLVWETGDSQGGRGQTYTFTD